MRRAGKWLGNRQIRCNWATKGAGGSSNEEKINDSQNAVVLTNGSSGMMHLSKYL
jgi:nucleolysin TIA-1/TIAR